MHQEDKFVAFSTGILDAIGRRIKIGKQELKLISKTENRKIQVQFKLVTENINELVEKAEQMGTCGQIEKASCILVKRSDWLK